MSLSYQTAQDFLKTHDPVVLVKIKSAKGSTPRSDDAFMLVSKTAFCGTIGGGRLEHMALEQAREILKGGSSKPLQVALGPELNQCCGGHVELQFTHMNDAKNTALLENLTSYEAANPWVYIFGAGHVGLALYRALSPLPFNVKLIDNRRDLPNPDNVPIEFLALPESMIKSAPEDTTYIIMTHDHALDFMLATAALTRSDAPYVGMIGSKTKRKLFEKQAEASLDLDKLTCPMAKPIANNNTTSAIHKQPEVIAAKIANELISHLI